MFSPLNLFLIVAAYFAALGWCGHWAEKRAVQGRDPTRNGLVYALSLTVYCTSWTFFGSVGSAANSGMLFSTIYLGPTLTMFFAWGLIRRLIQLRKKYNIASLADLISQRYGKSLPLSMFITLVLLLGMVPYVGLQLRAIVGSFTILTSTQHDQNALWTGHYTDEVFIGLIALFTCLFGLRRVDMHVRQTGLLAVLAVESVVKLVAFLAVGIFATYGLFGGLTDINARLANHAELGGQIFDRSLSATDYLNWVTYLLLAMSAIVFLPRMFHVLVVANDKESHLGTAMWVLPLYLLVISFFVMPIAGAGLLLGYPPASADWFVIYLPRDLGGPGLTLLSYLGGVSAAIGMVMVACTTMALMFSNHLVLPALSLLSGGKSTRIKVLQVRWALVFLLIWLSYQFQAGLENSYLLIQMGLISFAAVIQFAPPLLGAFYWRRSSTNGAWWGLALGWAVWFYALFLPATVRSLASDYAWLANGPWGVKYLRPEALFGLDMQSTLFNGVFWSLLFNALGFVVGSLLSPARDNELEASQHYLGLTDPGDASSADILLRNEVGIAAGQVWQDVGVLLDQYLPASEAHQVFSDIKTDVTVADNARLSGNEFLQLTQMLEKRLAGAIGAAMARQAVTDGLKLSEKDARVMQETYTQALAELKITPQQLRERVDYLRSMNELTAQHAAQLGDKLKALEEADAARKQADSALRESENRFRSLADSAPVMIWLADSIDGQNYFNKAWRTFTGKGPEQDQQSGWQALVHPQDQKIAQQGVSDAMLSTTSVSIRVRLQNAKSHYRWLNVQIMRRVSAEHEYLGLVGTAIDVSDLVEAEATLRGFSEKLQDEVELRTRELQLSLQSARDSEETIRTITNAAQDAVIMLNAAGNVSFWNPAATRIFGWTAEEALGLPLESFLVPERFRVGHHAGYLRFQLDQPGEVLGKQTELSALTRQGPEIPVELSLSATTLRGERHAVGLLRDITERKAAESELAQRFEELKALNVRLEEAQNQLLQSEKMASIGQLAAGVAHEINNPIGFVNSNLTTLRSYAKQMLALIDAYGAAESTQADGPHLQRIRKLKTELDLDFLRDDLPALLAESEDGLQRVKKIVQDLKSFSHVDEAEWQQTDINAGIESTLNVVWNEIKYKATVDKHYGVLPPVECLASQLNQVFMNLLINAVQAIEVKGTITITTEKDGDHVRIEVRDTGKGMTEEVKKRIFEPFFTTKPVGKGTGLGLSMSFGIIKKHHGVIEVESALGKGTVMRVLVPIKRVTTVDDISSSP